MKYYLSKTLSEKVKGLVRHWYTAAFILDLMFFRMSHLIGLLALTHTSNEWQCLFTWY